MVAIYGLASSEDGKIRYVGRTTASLTTRLRGHRAARNQHPRRPLSMWISDTERVGYSVLIFLIEDSAEPNAAEQRLIAWYRQHGADLVNVTAGGSGRRSSQRSEAERRAISRALKGKKKTPEHCAAMAAARRRLPPEVRIESARNAGRALKGRIPNNLLVIQELLRGRPKSIEHRRKLSLALLGKRKEDRRGLAR